MLFTHDITCNMSRRNSGSNDIYKKRSINTKPFRKNCFLNKFYIIFRFPVTMCIYINA